MACLAYPQMKTGVNLSLYEINQIAFEAIVRGYVVPYDGLTFTKEGKIASGSMYNVADAGIEWLIEKAFEYCGVKRDITVSKQRIEDRGTPTALLFLYERTDKIENGWYYWGATLTQKYKHIYHSHYTLMYGSKEHDPWQGGARLTKEAYHDSVKAFRYIYE
jgi:hypothetical protein